MKKIVALLLVMMMLASSAFAMTAGTYEGEAQGMMGKVAVSVVVTENAIESVTVTAQNETPAIATAALEQIPAAIVANQSLVVDTVAGATVTSNAIIAATEAALVAAGADVEAFKAVEAADDPAEVIEYTADVVVIGAGGSGVAAAVAAHDAGANVVLLEKTAAIGGTTATSQGLVGGYESKFTKEMDVHYLRRNVRQPDEQRLLPSGSRADHYHHRKLRRDHRLDG